MKLIRNAFLTLAALVALVLIVGGLYVAARQHLVFDAPYPAVAASADSAVIARGRYLVRHLADCGDCHGDPARRPAYLQGEEIALSGGREWQIPPGRFRAPNITPDRETGIGRMTDGAIARALRYGVGRDGRALLPFMEMQGLSDQDVAAVISYLRSQPPVANVVPPHQYNLLGMIVKATVLAKPVGPKGAPPSLAPAGPSVESGRYLAENVSNCWACHTQRDMNTGAIVGPRYGGTTGFTDDFDPQRSWSPPNITAGATTGRLARYSEEQFMARFRAGRAIPGSPMPWQAFGGMSDDDLRSIYRFLRSLPPIEREVGPAVVEKR